MNPTRENILAVIRTTEEGLQARHLTPADLSKDSLRDELRASCARFNVDIADYDRFIAANPEIAKLATEAFREGLSGGTDPGPYDAISRESPSGQPGDLTKTRGTGDSPRSPV